MADHYDLMYDCWRCNLKGGLKAVEQQLDIARQLQGISGWDTVLLWHRYQGHGDQNAPALLLKYNNEALMNLEIPEERLAAKRA